LTQELLDPSVALAAGRAARVDDPDRALLERWRAGEAAAFDALVRRHEGRVYRILLRLLGSPDEAEDASQETFLNLHRYAGRFRAEARFSTFVYRVAVNAALNRRRSLRRRRARLEALVEEQAGGHARPAAPRGPEEAALGREVQRRVQRAIVELSPRLRAPLVLYDIEGLPYAEVARVLGLPEGTVKSRIHRARCALRGQLRDLVSSREAAR